jgi:hypothetical protein
VELGSNITSPRCVFLAATLELKGRQ